MIEEILQEELAELQAKDLYRKIKVLKPISATRVIFQGREVLLFCGNDYLGLAHHPRVIGQVKQVASFVGVGAGAARLISGTSESHLQLEQALARLKGKEKALVFSAGYLANLGVLSALASARDLIIMDKLCHASLIDAARLSGATLRVYPHKNYDKCEELLAGGEKYGRKILVTDTVFSMDGDLADLNTLVALKKKYSALLIVDDAHGTGVFGTAGEGAIGDEATRQKIDVITGTLSKTVGTLGGFAAASGKIIDYLINFSRPFIFATALPPLLCVAALEALSVIREEPELRNRLWAQARQLHQGLICAGISLAPLTSPILPVLCGDEKRALKFSEKLLQEGVLVPAVRYPTVPKGKARLRITVSAAHEDADIQKLIKILGQIKTT